MTIIFDTDFMSTLILNAKAIFTSFVPYLIFLISILIAFHILQMIMSLLVGKRRRVRL